jgi:hypothetical protein
MSLHLITEPAGTLMTGWKLVPKKEPHAADIHCEEESDLVPEEDARTGKPHVDPASRWESERKLGEVG